MKTQLVIILTIFVFFTKNLIQIACTDIYTIGGNSEGLKCHFPFKYNNIIYNSCIDKEIEESNGTLSYAKICSTTPDYDTDKKWGFCLGYSMCYFPFTYNNQKFIDCISTSQASRMCAVTDNFDRDKKWMHCPIICSDYPEINGDVDKKNSFIANFNDTFNCNFGVYYSKATGETLRIHSQPPCTASYFCRNKAGENKVFCRLDGKFDQKATCIPDFDEENLSGSRDLDDF